MAISNTDLGMFLTGGAANTDPTLSRGGIVSTTEVISNNLHALFRRITESELSSGVTIYRCVALKNKSITDTMRNCAFYMVRDTLSTDDLALYSYAQADKNTVETTIVDEFTAPTGSKIDFKATLNRTGGLLLGDLAPGEYINIWLRISVNPGGLSFPDNTFIVRMEVNGTGTSEPPTPPSPPPTTPVERTIYYAATSAGSDTGSAAYKPLSSTTSHEIVEAQTDADPQGKLGKQAWRAYTTDNIEVADGYPDVQYTASGLWVNKYWSNSDNNSVAPTEYEVDLGSSTKFTTKGGKVLKNPAIYLIFWGLDWQNRVTDPLASTVISDIQTKLLVTNASYFNKLSQYDGCGLPTWGDAVFNTTTIVPSATNITREQIIQCLKDTFNSGLLPIPGPADDDLYVMVMPLGKFPTSLAGSTVLGYHNVELLTLGIPAGGGDPTINFSMATTADTGSGGTFTGIVSKMKSRNVGHIMFNGDLAYASSMTNWLNATSSVRSISKVSFGNHDVDDGDGSQSTINALKNAYNLSNTYYSYIYNNVGVVVMESGEHHSVPENTSSQQYTFVKQALEGFKNNPAIEWIFVFNHYPFYTPSSNHPAETDTRGWYQPLFDANGVDCVFVGHNHNMWYTKPLRYDATVVTASGTDPDFAWNRATPNHGQLYLGCGAGGRSHYSISSNPSYVPWSNDSKYGYLFMQWSNSGKKITFNFYDSSDNLLKTLTLTHT